MFTLNELESGIFVGTNRIKVEFVGSSKVVLFSKPVRAYVSTVSKLFYTDIPTMWELKEDDVLFSNEQFVQFVNLLIKDLMKNYDLISF